MNRDSTATAGNVVVRISFKGGSLLIGCALPTERAQPLFSHIHIIILFPPLSLSQYLDYIDNLGVKGFVLVLIELLVFLFTFRCTV